MDRTRGKMAAIRSEFVGCERRLPVGSRWQQPEPATGLPVFQAITVKVRMASRPTNHFSHGGMTTVASSLRSATNPSIRLDPNFPKREDSGRGALAASLPEPLKQLQKP
jgi:hypothetical protein